MNLYMAQLLLELVYTVSHVSVSVDKHLPASVRCQKRYVALSLTKRETKEGFQGRKHCVGAKIVTRIDH